ncbi:uncharacterized protein [Parasteatoda tepidariorum]|uniref:uncharacterized protein n=1 Tax=Parasteatoda tepidariorum TaxID=114398 RepID=UPI0039BD4230
MSSIKIQTGFLIGIVLCFLSAVFGRVLDNDGLGATLNKLSEMFNGGAANVLQNTGLSQMLEDNGLGEALNRVSEMVNNDGLAQALDSFGLGGVATSGQLDQLIRPENMQQAISKITDILGLENLQQILSQLTDGLDLGK